MVVCWWEQSPVVTRVLRQKRYFVRPPYLLSQYITHPFVHRTSSLIITMSDNVENKKNAPFRNEKVAAASSAAPLSSSELRSQSQHSRTTLTKKILKPGASEERLNELEVKYREELYWVQLELQTTRREKEAVEDRMAELYRDMQDLVTLSQATAQQAVAGSEGHHTQTKNQTSKPTTATSVSGLNCAVTRRISSSGGRSAQVDPITKEAVLDLQAQLEKRDKMIRVMNNQIALVRSSSDNVIKSLKDEISDLMDEKSRVEVNLMNQLTVLDREKRELQMRLEVAEQRQRNMPVSGSRFSHGPGGMKGKRSLSMNSAAHTATKNAASAVIASSSREPVDAHATSDATSKNDVTTVMTVEIKQLKATLSKCRAEALQSAKALSNEQRQVEKLKQVNTELLTQIEILQKELVVARSSAEVAHVIERMQQNRAESLQSLERVADLWDRADRSIQSLDEIMLELKPRDESLDDDRDRVLSTLETACLVHGQVKVALVLIELKLRNNMACFQNDKDHLDLGQAAAMQILSPSKETSESSTAGDHATQQASHYFDARLEAIQGDAMTAIAQVEDLLNEQIVKLEQQSAQEAEIVKITLESKVDDLQRMQTRQQMLEQEISRMHESTLGLTKVLSGAEGLSGLGGVGEGIEEEEDLFVSREVLEQLQNEVLQVVERLQEKNEIVGRLTATVEEHKVRERALMDELRRLMNEQAQAQEIERQKRMESLKALDGDHGELGEDEDMEGEPGEDGSYACESDEYIEEEVSVEETVYD